MLKNKNKNHIHTNSNSKQNKQTRKKPGVSRDYETMGEDKIQKRPQKSLTSSKVKRTHRPMNKTQCHIRKKDLIKNSRNEILKELEDKMRKGPQQVQ